MGAPIAVLMVDDDPDDRLLTRSLLEDIDRTAYRVTEVAAHDAALEAMCSGDFDVCLVDYHLGAFDGLEILHDALARGCSAPVILLTGAGDRRIDETAMRMGAADYLVKGQITPALLERTIGHAIERGRTLQALRESEERFRLLVDGVSDHAIFLLTPRGHVASWNAGAERMSGYTETEIVGEPIARFYAESDGCRDSPTELLETARAGGSAHDEGWRVRKDGSRFWAEATVTVLRDDAGASRGYAMVVRDITDRRRAEQERTALIREQVARADAEAATHARDEFLAVAAHEIRTPLTSILAPVQFLLQQLKDSSAVDKDDIRNRLTRIDQHTRKLARLINRVLDLSRVQTGRLELEREDVDLVRLVASAVDVAQLQTDRHTLVLNAPGTLEATLDPLRIEQVLVNLLDNAIKYSPEGGQISIEVSMPDPGSVRITVLDHGLGIPHATRTRVFEQFFRGHQTDHRSGMGIGLYISQQIVELHGGTITLEAPSGGGSSFTFVLPIAPPTPQGDPQASVSSTGPLAVMATVCSARDARLPSPVITVQPSAVVRQSSPPPAMSIGSIASTNPSLSTRPRLG
jgi:PAS domain S-box-containing protein